MGYSISFVIPAYNESENISTTIKELGSAVANLTGQWEIIVVDDGSVDTTGETVKELMQHNKRLRLISHPVNKGYGAALRTGFSNAKYELIFLLPADRQFEFGQIREFLKEIGEVDIVAGYRGYRKDSIFRQINGFIFNLAVKVLFGLNIKDIDCGFKLYRRGLFDNIRLSCSGALIDTELFYKSKKKNFKVKQIEVIHKPRLHGRSTGAHPKVIFYAMWEVINLWIRLRVLNIRE